MEGTSTGGTEYYQNGGIRSAVGPGWDCSNDCKGNPGLSGEKTKRKFITCRK